MLLGFKQYRQVSCACLLLNYFTGKILLLQREIPEHVNIVAAKTAREAGTTVILDIGGRDEPLSEELLHNVDIISPNEVSSVS